MGKHFLRLARNGHFFLLGLGSIADISGAGLDSMSPQEERISPLGRDFLAVGNDIRFAMAEHKALVAANDQKQLELALH